jgi:hypothetical protein
MGVVDIGRRLGAKKRKGALARRPVKSARRLNQSEEQQRDKVLLCN